jgi:4-carboxymuconolactone decarboxylase
MMCAASASAQQRMLRISDEQLSPEQAKVMAEVRAVAEAKKRAVATPADLFIRTPDIIMATNTIIDYIRFDSSIGKRLTELAILVTARNWSQVLEWRTHAQWAARDGLADHIIQAIGEGRRPDSMAEDEGIVYDFCTELQATHGVSDTTYARALAAFGERGIMDMVHTQAVYVHVAMAYNVARKQLPPGEKPGILPFPR